MTRKISRTVTRRIGTSDMVVSVRPEGLAMRRFRSHTEVLVMWETLFKEYVPAKVATEAFATAAPTRWLPHVGDLVFVRRSEWRFDCRARVTKVLAGCGEEIIRVKCRGCEHDVLLSQVRPTLGR
jgi:hypothetical protein